MNGRSKKIVIVGGGPVGLLQSCFMAEEGYEVHVFEKSHDIRTVERVIGRSINLSLSARGREALRRIGLGLETHIVSHGVPMFCRMIHDKDGSTHAIPYGKKEQYILSFERRRLNELLLTEAEKYKNVKIYFSHELVSCNFENNEASFRKIDSDEKVTIKYDLLFGCDGAYSVTRKQIMNHCRISYNQEYISDMYIELRIGADKNGKFIMPENNLHIWPRETFMLIAMPNGQDNSFVVTLFMDASIFELLSTEQRVIQFFEENFKDALELIGRKEVIRVMTTLKPRSLISIKCYPYHAKDNIVLFGDAAHAMVPFYGQGLNCGFEDLLVFNDFLKKHDHDLCVVLPEYSKYRSLDAHCINDLAMFNYKEMRSDVNSRLFLLRKKVDGLLHKFFPKIWIPLYTMVTFTRLRYHECASLRRWQDRMLRKIVYGCGAFAVLLASYAGALYLPQYFSQLTELFYYVK